VAIDLLAFVVLSFYVRRWIGYIGYKWWRAIHYLSFAVFLLTLMHGLLGGTGGALPWIIGLNMASGLSVAGLIVCRIVRARSQRRIQPSSTRLQSCYGHSGPKG
jgi:predicted ferric reductase